MHMNKLIKLVVIHKGFIYKTIWKEKKEEN